MKLPIEIGLFGVARALLCFYKLRKYIKLLYQQKDFKRTQIHLEQATIIYVIILNLTLQKRYKIQQKQTKKLISSVAQLSVWALEQ